MRFVGLRAISALLMAVGVLAAWWYLAPRSLGGRDTYVVVDGPSMEPILWSGDLLILRQAPVYRVGQIVGYRTPQLRAPIVHQIIAVHRGHFSTKGVNNAFVDPAQPTSREVVGRLWLDLGRLGTVLRTMQRPAVGGPLLGLAAATAAVPRRRRRRRPRHPFRTERRPDGLPIPDGHEATGSPATGLDLSGQHRAGEAAP
jgi:signal peptidase I